MCLVGFSVSTVLEVVEVDYHASMAASYLEAKLTTGVCRVTILADLLIVYVKSDNLSVDQYRQSTRLIHVNIESCPVQ